MNYEKKLQLLLTLIIAIDGEFNMNKIQTIWNGILDMLPREPRSYDTSDDAGFWTNGDEILCPSETDMFIVCSFLDDVFSKCGNYNLITGWYDPFEDVNNGETDDCTGSNYIRLE